jgi:hypothetical protein
MKIVITINELGVAENIMEKDTLSIGSEYKIPGNALIKYNGKQSKRKGIMPGITETLEFSLTFLSGAASSLVANWLFSKLKKNNINEIQVETEFIQVSENNIKRVVKKYNLINKE